MTEEKMRPNRLDWELVGEPILAGGRTIQPVARLSGWAGGNMSEQGGGAGAWVRVRPVEVVVREADGTESRVPIVDAEQAAIRGMVVPALAVAGICAAIIAGKMLFGVLRARCTFQRFHVSTLNVDHVQRRSPWIRKRVLRRSSSRSRT